MRIKRIMTDQAPAMTGGRDGGGMKLRGGNPRILMGTVVIGAYEAG